MSFQLHTVSVIAGQPAYSDRLAVGLFPAQAFAAGGGAGQSVTFTVSGKFPAKYIVLPGAISQDAVVTVTGRTQTGFTVTVTPRLAASTLAAGTLDLLVVA